MCVCVCIYMCVYIYTHVDYCLQKFDNVLRVFSRVYMMYTFAFPKHFCITGG